MNNEFYAPLSQTDSYYETYLPNVEMWDVSKEEKIRLIREVEAMLLYALNILYPMGKLPSPKIKPLKK